MQGPRSTSPPVAVGTLDIGLFFDGTGCNKDNLQQARPVPGPAMVPGTAPPQDDFGVPHHSPRVDSYSNALTNIARLHALYPDSTTLTAPVSEPSNGAASAAAASATGPDDLPPDAPLALAIYVEGSGTRSGQPDDLGGLAFGTGTTGVLAKVEHALHDLLPARLRALAAAHPTRVIHRTNIDLFGFSRGAAAARHSVHLCNAEADNPVLQALRGSGLALATGFGQAQLRVRFVGLFDTVVAVGGRERRRLRVGLPAGCAAHVVQFAARDERRRNFPLTTVAPEHREHLLPGAHSNVGGGFAHPVEGPKLLTRPRRQRLDADGLGMGEVPSLDLLRASRAYRDAVAQCMQWRERLGLGAQHLWVDVWHHWQHMRRAGSPSVLPEARLSALAGVVLKRPYDARLQWVALRLMQHEAAAAGARWQAHADDVPALALPDDLRPIATRLLRGEAPTFAQEALLRQRYILQSAHWNLDILGGIAPAHPQDPSTPRLPFAPAPALVYINQPTSNGQRVVLANR